GARGAAGADALDPGARGVGQERKRGRIAKPGCPRRLVGDRASHAHPHCRPALLARFHRGHRSIHGAGRTRIAAPLIASGGGGRVAAALRGPAVGEMPATKPPGIAASAVTSSRPSPVIDQTWAILPPGSIAARNASSPPPAVSAWSPRRIEPE